MTLKDIADCLRGTGLPVIYRAWADKTAPPLPYICYIVAYSNNFGADNCVHQKINHVQVELYTAVKDPESEDKVENALSSLFWEKTETYIDTEECYQILYEIEV